MFITLLFSVVPVCNSSISVIATGAGSAHPPESTCELLLPEVIDKGSCYDTGLVSPELVEC